MFNMLFWAATAPSRRRRYCQTCETKGIGRCPRHSNPLNRTISRMSGRQQAGWALGAALLIGIGAGAMHLTETDKAAEAATSAFVCRTVSKALLDAEQYGRPHADPGRYDEIVDAVIADWDFDAASIVNDCQLHPHYDGKHAALRR